MYRYAEEDRAIIAQQGKNAESVDFKNEAFAPLAEVVASLRRLLFAIPNNLQFLISNSGSFIIASNAGATSLALLAILQWRVIWERLLPILFAFSVILFSYPHQLRFFFQHNNSQIKRH